MQITNGALHLQQKLKQLEKLWRHLPPACRWWRIYWQSHPCVILSCVTAQNSVPSGKSLCSYYFREGRWMIRYMNGFSLQKTTVRAAKLSKDDRFFSDLQKIYIGQHSLNVRRKATCQKIWGGSYINRRARKKVSPLWWFCDVLRSTKFLNSEVRARPQKLWGQPKTGTITNWR